MGELRRMVDQVQLLGLDDHEFFELIYICQVQEQFSKFAILEVLSVGSGLDEQWLSPFVL